MTSRVPIFQEARFSDCGKFRYLLIRQWGAGKFLPFVLLNPSTAGKRQDGGAEEEEDQTSTKGIGFAQRLGYAGMVFANLYDFCATKPKDLKAAGYPRSPDADRYILKACGMGDGIVICGWGANARGLSRPSEVLALIRSAGYQPMALRLLADGIPEHPLMLPYTCTPIPFTS